MLPRSICFIHPGHLYILEFASPCPWCSGSDTCVACERSKDWSPVPEKSEFSTHFHKRFSDLFCTGISFIFPPEDCLNFILHGHFVYCFCYHWYLRACSHNRVILSGTRVYPHLIRIIRHRWTDKKARKNDPDRVEEWGRSWLYTDIIRINPGQSHFDPDYRK